MSKEKSLNGNSAATTRGVQPGMEQTIAVENEGEEPQVAIPSQPRLKDLVGIGSDAVRLRPPLWISSILGLPWTWIPPYRRFSEFSVLNLWRLRRTLKYLTHVLVPSIPRTPPPFGPPLISSLFWQPSVILQRPDHNGSYTTFPEEAWFFLNGIMTDDSLAQMNAAYITYLFHRPLTLIQNSTDSFAVDLLQCMLGKEWTRMTEPVIKAFPPIYDALKSPYKRKVVVLAHSQGTIIIANVLRMLYQLTGVPEEALEKGVVEYAGPEMVYPEQFPIALDEFEPLEISELAKLEVYCFATCANRLAYFDADACLPWIEHFGNEHDLVARLGMLAPNKESWEIAIDGPCYRRAGAWGHFLNEHYLFAVEDHQKSGRKKGGAGNPAPYELLGLAAGASPFGHGPRLFEYINGGIPAD